jgi:hypothetical protein
MFIWTFLLRITHTIISQSIADSSWITLYMGQGWALPPESTLGTAFTRLKFSFCYNVNAVNSWKGNELLTYNEGYYEGSPWNWYGAANNWLVLFLFPLQSGPEQQDVGSFAGTKEREIQMNGRLQTILCVTGRGKKALPECAGNNSQEIVTNAEYIVRIWHNKGEFEKKLRTSTQVLYLLYVTPVEVIHIRWKSKTFRFLIFEQWFYSCIFIYSVTTYKHCLTNQSHVCNNILRSIYK